MKKQDHRGTRARYSSTYMTMPSRYLPGRYLGQAKVFARRHGRNGADAESNLGGWEKSNGNLVRANALWVACTRFLPEHQDVRLGRVAKVILGEDLCVQLYSLLDVAAMCSCGSCERVL
jgi:hypothetical protein